MSWEELLSDRTIDPIRQEYLGKVLPQESGRQEVFLKDSCPDKLTVTECLTKGDSTGIYHYQSWLREPCFCRRTIDHATGYYLKDNMYALVCSCKKVIDVYQSIVWDKEATE